MVAFIEIVGEYYMELARNLTLGIAAFLGSIAILTDPVFAGVDTCTSEKRAEWFENGAALRFG